MLLDTVGTQLEFRLTLALLTDNFTRNASSKQIPQFGVCGISDLHFGLKRVNYKYLGVAL